MASKQQIMSPGNQYYPDMPPMRAPHLEFVYRLEAKMHPTNKYEIENIQGTGVTRSVGHIQTGTVKGPKINGVVVENSGADWAQRIHCKKVFYNREVSAQSSLTGKIYYKLDARYAIRTDDGHTIFIHALGIFRPGPIGEFDYNKDKPERLFSQDDVEYFTHITFEAAEDSPYNWMNGIVAIGALQSYNGAAVIDCWRLTNFPGVEVEDVYVGRWKLDTEGSKSTTIVCQETSTAASCSGS